MLSKNQTSMGFFSQGSLSKNDSHVTLTEKDLEGSDIVRDAKILMFAVSGCLLNPSLIIPFFLGPIYSQIPHLRSRSPLGHLDFNGQVAEELIKTAQKTPNGIATFWAGPFPILYVTSNHARLSLVQESHVGVVDNTSSEYLYALNGGNKVMSSFPAFRPINSLSYNSQRTFLRQLYHTKSKQWLPEINAATINFLQLYSKEQSENSHSLRKFITALVLHTSSYLLGLTQTTLDKFYFAKLKYEKAIDRVAHYGISERIDPEFEEILYELFVEILQANFANILDETPESNLIRNIFASMDVEFPQVFADFDQLPEKIRLTIAMNFAATGLGGMVHSTANTLDWAIARLLNDRNKWIELTTLMEKYNDLDLIQESIFDKEGELFPLCEWVLHNVFLYPPFAHEFFLNRESYTATLSDNTAINIQRGSITIVNYVQCNRSNEQMASLKTFSDSLEEKSTAGKFIMNQNVASFGGSKTSKENRKTRVCPGAKTSLYEQMIMLAILLRDYSLKLDRSKEISCEVDMSMHPLCTRVNIGDIKLSKKYASQSHKFFKSNEMFVTPDEVKGISPGFHH